MCYSYDCYISFGSNLGDRVDFIKKALQLLNASDKIQLISVSSFYETPPWGKLDQPGFINGAACLRTSLSIYELLHLCQAIELQLGRERHERWGPRTIDIDLLWADGIESDLPELRLPHPYMLERLFVLIPLQEIAPDLVIAGNGLAYHVTKLENGSNEQITLAVPREQLEALLLNQKGVKVYD